MAAWDDKSKDTRKSLHISILGDIFKSADNCRLPIIVESALRGGGQGKREGEKREWEGGEEEEGEEGAGGGRRGGGRREGGPQEGEGRKKGREGERENVCARKARTAPEGRRETRGRRGR